MFQDSFRSAFNRILAVLTLIFLSATVAWSGGVKVLHSFGRNTKTPSSGLVVDKAGNAYGTTAVSGVSGAGAVYRLSPTPAYQNLYGFGGSPDGKQPQGNLVIDAAGNLYGTTVYGGANKKGCNNHGCGTVFRLTPPTNGGVWTETVLYSFSGGDDGANPQAGVILDSGGNLYGTTISGGTLNAGVVFEFNVTDGTESVLYTFSGGDGDGGSIKGGLILDNVGNLYGMSGATVFEMSPGVGGQWTFTVIHAFNPKQGDGQGAAAGLVLDLAGNLYGTTTFGGEFGFGTVFELTPNGGGWTESVLYSFVGGHDGATPEATPVLDSAGSLYGTTFAGGSGGTSCQGNGCGTVFQLTPGQNGLWTERRFVFPSDGSLGDQPKSSLLIDKAGRVYGTTTTGGFLGSGVVFRITP